MTSSTPFRSSETKTVSVSLPVGYVEWIQSKAEQHDVTTAEVVAALVDMQRKRDAQQAAGGDESPPENSVADDLQSASQRLRNLVDRAEALDDEPMDVLERVEARLNGQVSSARVSSARGDGQSGSNPDDVNLSSDASGDTRSMFDLMNDDG